MPQLVPFYFLNQIIYGYTVLLILIYDLIKYYFSFFFLNFLLNFIFFTFGSSLYSEILFEDLIFELSSSLIADISLIDNSVREISSILLKEDEVSLFILYPEDESFLLSIFFFLFSSKIFNIILNGKFLYCFNSLIIRSNIY